MVDVEEDLPIRKLRKMLIQSLMRMRQLRKIMIQLRKRMLQLNMLNDPIDEEFMFPRIQLTQSQVQTSSTFDVDAGIDKNV